MRISWGEGELGFATEFGLEFTSLPWAKSMVPLKTWKTSSKIATVSATRLETENLHFSTKIARKFVAL